MRGNNNSDLKLQNVSSYELSSLSSNVSTNESTNINSNIISKLSPSSSTKIVEFLSDKFKNNLKVILDEKESDNSISSSRKVLLDCSSSQCTTYECSCSQDSSSILYHQNLICCSRSSCLLSTCCTSKIEILNYKNKKINFNLDNDNRSENSSTINNANHVLTEDQSTYNQSENSCISLDDTLQNDDLNSFSELPLKVHSKNFQKYNNLNALIMHTNEINCSTGEQPFSINNLKLETKSETLNKFFCDGKNCSNSKDNLEENKEDNSKSEKNNVFQNYENFNDLNSDDSSSSSISHKIKNNSDLKKVNNFIDFSSLTYENDEQSFNEKDDLSSDPNKSFKKIVYENSNISSRSLNSFENKNYLNDEKSKEVLLPNNFLKTKNNSEILGSKMKLDSGRLISINFEDKDDSKSEEEKSRQLHLNTLSDISMLTFPEVEENVDTYKLHASSRCLLNCSPNQCSSKKHNDLDESNNFCDLTLMRDYSELGSSTAQVRFLDENDYGNLKFTDATLNSGDHSSELDSDLDNAFDQDDDELDLLENTDISIKKNNHVLNQCSNEQFEYNHENVSNNIPYWELKNDNNESQYNEDKKVNNKKLKTINGFFKEEASIVLKNKQNKNDLEDSCPAKKANYNNTFNEYSSNNKENLNGYNDSEKINGNSKAINCDNTKINSNGISSVKVNTAKAQKKFSQDSNEDGNCPICDKNVYQVEKIKAEKRVFHKQCFRCLDCRKQLSMDSYYSHKGKLYCQVHFKLLLRPKPVENIGDDYLSRRQKTIIIRESIPQELPPDVVRSESKIDDGLDSIQLDLTNLRQRFENGNRSFDEIDRPNSSTERNLLQRSESILAKVQRYQSLASGEKMANSDGESVNSDHFSDNENDLAKENLTRKEKVSFNGLSAIKSQFENGVSNNGNIDDGQSVTTNGSNGRDEETKQELFKLRQRICLGRSASMKQVYENQAVSNKSTSPTSSNDRQTRINTSSMKEKFEKGNFTTENELEFKERLRREVDEELNVVTEADTAAKEAKNKFKEMEKLNNSQQNNQLKHSSTEQLNNNTRSTPTHHPKVTTYLKQETPVEIIKGSEPGQKEEVHINVNQLQERYRFFEQQVNSNTNEEKIKTIDTPRRPIQLPKATEDCFVETPNDQIKRDPNIIRSSDVIDDLPKSDIAKKMLNVFQQLEKSNSNSNVTAALNGAHEKPPLRCITPPKEFTIDNEDETDTAIDCQQDKDIVRSSYKEDKSIPVEPEIARNLRAKFENWASEVENENKKNINVVETINEEIPQSDITKNMRSKFESYCEEINKPLEKNTKLKINRFVNNFGSLQFDLCNVCQKKIYLMDKVEFNKWKVHRKCFKCCHCSSSLRLENYTSSFGKLYCLVHFRQLFMTRGNYDEGFGREQHKEKWSLSKKMNISQNSSGNSSRNDSPDPDSLDIDSS